MVKPEIKMATDEELKDADALTIDIIAAMHLHRPDIIDAAKSLTEALSGAVLQIEKGPARDRLRQLIIEHIMADEGDESLAPALDLADYLKRKQH